MTVQRFRTATILDTTDTTDVAFFMTDSEKLARFYVDANFDGTTLSVLASDEADPEVFVALLDDTGAAVSITAAADTMIGVDIAAGPLASCYAFKLQSDAPQAGADCEIKFWTK